MESSQQNVLAQMYDYSLVREYKKIISGFIFSHEITVRKDSIKNDIVLNMTAPTMPTKVYFNNEEYQLIKK